MKKFLLCLFSALLLTLTACTNKAEEVHKKIQESPKELTQEDFMVMVDYIDDHASDIRKCENDEEINEAAPYANEFARALFAAGFTGKLNKETAKAAAEAFDKCKK